MVGLVEVMVKQMSGRYPAHLDCREQRAVKRLFLLFVGQALAVKACLYTYTLICC